MDNKVVFTNEMKESHTILVPPMSPYHFEFLTENLVREGYRVKLLDNSNSNIKKIGLKYVHNDMCYPAILVIGQIIDAIENEKMDSNKIAVIMMQTGGGCRMSNYIHIVRSALGKAGYGHIPVISLSTSKLEEQSGFKLTGLFWKRALICVMLGDVLQQLHNETRPYELIKGEADSLLYRCITKLNNQYISTGEHRVSVYHREIKSIINEFSNIKKKVTLIPKIGIVGEIYMKYSPLGNNNLEDFLLREKVEIVVPALMDYILFKVDYRDVEVDLYGGKRGKKIFAKLLILIIEYQRIKISKVLKKHSFYKIESFYRIRLNIKGFIGRGNRMGEGWLLTAEIIELLKCGVTNIVCAQPFGCLPNHVTGKGVLNSIKRKYVNSNIVAIDYDSGVSEVNQKNRLKLMLSIAKNEPVGKKRCESRTENSKSYHIS